MLLFSLNKFEITLAKVTLTLTTRSNNKFFRFFISKVLITFSFENTSEHSNTNLRKIIYIK